jgi:hypothetical protein
MLVLICIQVFAACVKKYDGDALADSGEFYSEVIHIEKSQLSLIFVIGNYEARIFRVESTTPLEEDDVHLIQIKLV